MYSKLKNKEERKVRGENFFIYLSVYRWYWFGLVYVVVLGRYWFFDFLVVFMLESFLRCL